MFISDEANCYVFLFDTAHVQYAFNGVRRGSVKRNATECNGGRVIGDTIACLSFNTS